MQKVNYIKSKKRTQVYGKVFLKNGQLRCLSCHFNGLMLDTYQLGDEQTKVKDQLSILIFSLEKLINPISIIQE